MELGLSHRLAASGGVKGGPRIFFPGFRALGFKFKLLVAYPCFVGTGELIVGSREMLSPITNEA